MTLDDREAVHKQLEISRKENATLNKLLLAILESMPDAFFIKDAEKDYKYILANKQFCKVIGHPNDSITGKDDFELFSFEVAEHNRERDIQVAEDGTIQIEENGIKEYSGQKRIWHTVKFPLIDKDNDRKLVIGMYHDISDMVKVKQELENSKTLLEYSFAIGKIIHWELEIPAGQLYSGNRNSIIAPEGMSFEEYINTVVHPIYREQVTDSVNDVINDKAKELNLRVQIFRFTKYEWMHMVGQKITDPQSKQSKIIGISRIITEEVEQQQELALAKQKAEKSDALKSAFLANMSHEIRTPLNSLVGFSQLICITEDKKEQQEYMDIINHNSELLLNLINDILDLSRIEAGFIDCSDHPFNLTEVLLRLEATIHPQIKPGVDLCCNIPSHGIYVKLDKMRIIQILMNFLTNAAKFTETGTIEIGCEVIDEGIRLYVKDTGCGIDESFLDRVFDRFEKHNEFKQGTGLGLAICQVIVNTYHGKIGVDSQKDIGSTFWVYIPTEISIVEISSNVQN